jgi:hypothetical protein
LNFRAPGLLLWVGERDPARWFAADVLSFWSPGPGGAGRCTLVVGLLLLLLVISWGCFLVGWGLFGPFVLCACVPGLGLRLLAAFLPEESPAYVDMNH